MYTRTCVSWLVSFASLFECSLLADQSSLRFLARRINAALRSWTDRWHMWCATTQTKKKGGGGLKRGVEQVISRRWSIHTYSSDAIEQWTHCRFVCLYISAFRNAWNTFRMQELNTLNIPFNLSNPRCFPFTSLTCPQATCLVSCFGGNG